MGAFRVCVEATSLVGPRSGVGHTTAALVEHLVQVDDDLEISLLPITVRGAGRLGTLAPRHERIHALRVRLPARLMQRVWTRASWPPAELFCGQVEVFHGPNFLLPPLVRAAGVLTVHDLAFESVPQTCSPHVRGYSRSVPVSAARAHRVVVPSRFVADELRAWLPDTAGRVVVIPQAVRDVFLADGAPLNEPRREQLGIADPYVLYVGNLELRKNVDLLLRAFPSVRRRRPDAQLVLVGAPGHGWDQIEEQHAELLSTDAVRRCGYLPDAEVAALVRGARAFVYPSRYEGFGLPPLEAMAAGTPVIAAKAGAMPEALGDHAQYVHPDDDEGLAAAMSDLLDGAADANETYAAKTWAAGFTWHRTAAATARVYREAAAEAAS